MRALRVLRELMLENTAKAEELERVADRSSIAITPIVQGDA